MAIGRDCRTTRLALLGKTDARHDSMPLIARLTILLFVLTGCEATLHRRTPDGVVDASRGSEVDGDVDAPESDATALVPLEPTQGRYRAVCDGSSGVALDFTHFLAFSDNDQQARVYQRGATAVAQQTIDVSPLLGMTTNDEADLEDAVRIDNRIYVLGSHGRKNDGTIDSNRYRFAAFDVQGTAPAISLFSAGRSSRLLQDMLDAANWSAPDAAVISALVDATQLAQPKVASLAPKLAGLNIEGLARAPTTATPDRLVLGLRNPQLAGRAIVVTLMNPSSIVGGAVARFGEAIQLDLGGLGIRGMSWSETLQTVLVLAGPHDGSDGPYRLYRWAGIAASTPVLVTTLTAPVAGGHPEAILTYATSNDIEVLFDSDDIAIGGTTCDNAPTTSREFADLIVHLE